MKDRLTPDLLRALCHELRGPLGALGNWVHVLNSSKAGEEARTRALAGIAGDVETMNDLVSQLASLASVLGGPAVEPTVLDVAPFVEGLLSAAAKESGHSVRLSILGPSPKVMASPMRLREMLWLFVASVEDSPDRARGLSVSTDGANVEFAVETLHPRPLTLALASALAEIQGGDMVETACEGKAILRFRLRLAT